MTVSTARRPTDSDAPPRPALDLRLAVVAAAAWLAVLLLDRTGAVAVGWVAAACCVATVVVTPLARRGGSWRTPMVLTALIGAGLALVLAPLAVRLGHVEASALLPVGASGRVGVTLVVTGDARALRSSGSAGAPRVVVDAHARSVLDRGVAVPVDVDVLVLAPADGWSDLVPGQTVRVDASVQPPRADPLLGAVLSVSRAPTLVGRPPAVQRWAAHVRVALRQACAPLPPAPRGLLPGLIVGDTSGLDPILVDRFRTAGLSHLVAVSGTNCMIVVGAAVLLLRRTRAGPRLTAAVAAVLLVGFVLIARPSPSVIRAAVMAAIGLAALAAGRTRAVVPALAAAVLGGLLWRPGLAHDPGFAMSVFATAAIVLFAPGLSDRFRRRRVPRGLAEAVAVAAVAHLVTAPVAAVISGRFSLVAIPANVLAEPVVAVTTVLGFVAAVLAALTPALGVGPAWLAGWPCRWLIAVADHFGGTAGATIGWGAGWLAGCSLLGALVVVALVLRWPRTRRVAVAALLTALVVQIPLRPVLAGWPPPGWWFVACDVGQGDGLVLQAGRHSAVVVDTGPDPVLMDACLRGLGVRHVPLLVLTHMDLDHVGGVAGVFHDRDVGTVVTSPVPEPPWRTAAVRRVLDTEGLPLLRAPIGGQATVGDVRLQFLGPAASELAGCDPNDCSVISRATVRGRSVLLSADESTEAQDALLATGVDLSADVLKVPHHGSAYSDARFFAAAHARLAVISVGLGNSYGHPAPRTMAALGRLHMTVARTDLDGAVAVSTGASGALRVSTRKQQPVVPAASGRSASTGGVSSAPGTPVMSAASVTMRACRPPAVVPDLLRVGRPPWPARTASTRSPARSPSHRSSSCSATRSCWSRAPPR